MDQVKMKTEMRENYIFNLERASDNKWNELFAKANDKNNGDEIPHEEILCLALHLVTDDHIRTLQKQSLIDINTYNQLS